MKTKNGHILTFSEKMQISAILCFATCDWFCPMTSHLLYFIVKEKDITILLINYNNHKFKQNQMQEHLFNS